MSARSLPLLETEPAGVPEKALWMVVFVIFFDMMADQILTPILAPYARDKFNASNVEVGYLFAFPCAAAFFASGFISDITNRIGRRPVFIIGCLGLSAGAFCQALAQSYWMLAAGRTFSGVWMCLFTTAVVYINETTVSDVRSSWQGRVSAFQAAGALFGPGLGGGLSHYGLNVPSFATAFIELVAAFLAYLYLDESPEFKRKRASIVKSGTKTEALQTSQIPIGSKQTGCREVWYYWLASTFTQSHQKLTQSIFALFAISKYSLTAVDISFVFLAAATGTLVAAFFCAGPLNRWLGVYRAGVFVSVVQAIGTLAMPFFPAYRLDSEYVYQKLWFVAMVLCFVVVQASSNLATSFESAMSGDLGGKNDQAHIQAGALRCRMAGKVVAPLVGTYLINFSVTYAWIFGVVLAIGAAPLCLLLQPPAQDGVRGRRHSTYGVEWTDEDGSRQDVIELGEYMADLLKRKHFKWVSHKEEVRRYIDLSLPDMPMSSKEEYQAALHTPLVGLSE